MRAILHEKDLAMLVADYFHLHSDSLDGADFVFYIDKNGGVVCEYCTPDYIPPASGADVRDMAARRKSLNPRPRNDNEEEDSV